MPSKVIGFEQVAATSTARINPNEGVIYGVSLITVGPALGHGVMCDATTLEQVKAASEQYSGGLKVKMNHSGGAGDIVGYISQIRIEGPKLVGDLHLLQSSPHKTYILEIAQKIPDTFGLSIAFSGPTEKSADGLTTLQRCTEIYSVDLVSEPAANPDGFFSTKYRANNYSTMNEDMTKALEAISTAVASLGDRLSKLESAVPPAPVAEKPEGEDCAMKSQSEVVQLAANAAALAAVKEFAKTFGAPAAPLVSAEVKAPATKVEKFEDIVAAKAVELKGDKSAAISFAIKNHSALYTAYRARVAGGEIVKL